MSPEDLVRAAGPAIFEHAPCLAALIDRRHRLRAVNACFREAFGEPDGRTCFAAMKGRDRACEPCGALPTLERGEARRYEDEATAGDGRPLPCRVRSLPVRDADGEVGGAVLLAFDRSEVASLKEQLHQTERLATVGLTTAGLAHSIKNLLGGLDGGMYVVTSGLEKDDRDRVRDGWRMVKRYIEQVSSLVRNLLRYAKAQEPLLEETDLAELAEEVVGIYASKADLAGVAVEADVEPGLEPMRLEREALKGGLANLVGNALDACMWDPDEAKAHRVTLAVRRREGGGVRIEVVDNGTGIPREHRHKVLSASFTTKGMRGTGLGLLLTKKTIEEHGGSIRYTTATGEGTTFCIELPERVAEGPAGPEGQGDSA